ncbi:SCO2400 family protein [Streptomyces sp. NPDC001537]
MDYCSSCRRHLNGALVCPGCGAYAPDIAPVTSHGRPAPAPAATAMWPEVEEPPATEAYADAGTGAAAAIPLSEGRAARRRQRARWKKNQRKAVVATAVALVGGGLTVASMDRGSSHRAEASTATDLSSMGSEDGTADQNAQLPPAGTGKHRKPDATPDRSAATSGKAQQRSGVTASHTDSARTQPYTAAAHSTPATKPAQQGSVATVKTPSVDTTPVTGGTTTTTQTPSATPTGSTGSGTSSTSGSSGTSGSSSTSGTSQSGNTSSSSATSPSGICVLGLLCVS